MVFFQVVFGASSKIRRTKVEGQHSLSGLKLVSVHKLLFLDTVARQATVSVAPVTVDLTPGSTAFALHPAMLSSDSLLSIQRWETHDDALNMYLANHYNIDPKLKRILPAALRVLFT